MGESNNQSRSWGLVIVGGFLAVLLCVMTGVAGYAIGRSSATPETIVETITQTVTEMQEVTREVEVPVTVVVPATGETAGESTEVEAPASPTPVTVETADSATTPFDAQNADFALFYEVWDIVEGEFDGELPIDEDMLYAAIAGSLETLGDEYTRFVPPDVAARLREDLGGSVEGIGAFVRENEEGQIEIVRPIDGQPADLAGLKPGDLIIGVDGESVVGQTLDEVILKVRGPRDTQVTLTIARPGEEEPLEFTITRTRFEVPIIESEMLPENIAYIRLSEFNRNAEEQTLEALETLLAQNPEGLIFDLRDNPGGFLDQSIAVADIFLGQSTVLFERNNQGLDQTFTADNGDLGETIPMVVLVNAGSASASEIVAGAIQDNGRAILIGEVTFGKGSVQQIHTLSNGAELRVTIARWYTPSNHSISGEGVTPDIEVESPEDLGGENDTQLQRAVEYILTGQ